MPTPLPMDHGVRGRRSEGAVFCSREVPPALSGDQQAELKAAAAGRSPSQAGIDLSNWNWKAVRQFVSDHFGLSLSRSSCLNYLHRLGFVLKRPKQRLGKADPVRRALRGRVCGADGGGPTDWGQDILR